ncbi:MAG: HIT family protein [bacterium]
MKQFDFHHWAVRIAVGLLGICLPWGLLELIRPTLVTRFVPLHYFFLVLIVCSLIATRGALPKQRFASAAFGAILIALLALGLSSLGLFSGYTILGAFLLATLLILWLTQTTMNDCIFCRIAAQDVPSIKIYEDENCVAVMDISPAARGHALVIPRVHSENILDAEPEVLAKILPVVQKIGQAVVKGLPADGFTLIVNNGEASGQVVKHLHLHIVPRIVSDGLSHWGKIEVSPEENERLAARIRESL